jgi:hypothetical protein
MSLMVLPVLAALGPQPLRAQIRLQVLGTHSTGIFNGSASEVGAYDPGSRRFFTVSSAQGAVNILDLTNPAAPMQIGSISTLPYGANPNGVATCNGIVAVAVEADVRTNPGKVAFFTTSGVALSSVTVGALPDMVTYTPNCRRLLVANEGEPSNDYLTDPEGSISIIDMTAGAANLTDAHVRTATFTAFNNAALAPSIRIFGPGATVAKDLEPEYITVSHDSRTAWVTLQENNAIAVLDIETATVTQLVGLGFKDHNSAGNGLDPSNVDGGNLIANWPLRGIYQPDALAAYHDGKNTFLVMANEGDARAYTGYTEETSVSLLLLDPVAFPNAANLQLPANLGNLRVTTANGRTAGGMYNELYSFGARSFSIRSSSGALIYDSGDQIEQIINAVLPTRFNANHTSNSRDNRSDDKGPEPEGVTIGKAFGRTYAFIGLERIGGVMVFDITNAYAPAFVQYINNRNFSQTPGLNQGGDLGPEGLVFIKAEDSPNGRPLLVVCNEVSGTTTIFEITKT